jgi:hypothetical protein
MPCLVQQTLTLKLLVTAGIEHFCQMSRMVQTLCTLLHTLVSQNDSFHAMTLVETNVFHLLCVQVRLATARIDVHLHKLAQDNSVL